MAGRNILGDEVVDQVRFPASRRSNDVRVSCKLGCRKANKCITWFYAQEVPPPLNADESLNSRRALG